MRKGSVRWETIGLRSKAGEIWRVLDRLIGQQNKTLNETNPSINAKLPATPHNLVGEVRDGVAAMSLFQDLMTGHIGACTFHADSPLEAARRLATVKGADA